MRIIRLFFILILFSLGYMSVFAVNKSEDINYVISYKWGLIQKDAGTAKITKRPVSDGYELKLMGKTKPWADKFYKVRDTLISIVEPLEYLPKKYTRIAHEKNVYQRDEINFHRAGTTTKGNGIKYRERKDGSVYEDTIELEAESPAYDLLSIFFHLRNIDYAGMKPGETIKTSVFSGDKAEILTLTAKGIETVKLKDSSRHEAMHITFRFTMRGGKKSSDDIDCWISTDENKIPLLIIGSLPIGQIRCTYEP